VHRENRSRRRADAHRLHRPLRPRRRGARPRAGRDRGERLCEGPALRGRPGPDRGRDDRARRHRRGRDPALPVPGLEGVACLLDAGMPPARCLADELPTNVTRPAARARALVDQALAATTETKRRSLGKRIVNALRSADRALARRQNAKRGPKPSVLCGADTHGVLQRAMARAGAVVCAPSAGLLSFAAASYEVSEDAGSVTVEITRTGGSDGKVTATITPGASTATVGLDWQRPAPIVVFNRRESGSRSLTVPILDDRAGEPDETVVLELTTEHG